MLAWQVGFPLFAWKPRWRFLLVGGAVIGWLGMVFVYRLPLFGPAILIGCLGYLTPAEWQRLTSQAVTLSGLRWLRRRFGVAVPAPRVVQQPGLATEGSASLVAPRGS
jgi:hypothetical protein